MAAQNNAIRINYIKARIYKTQQNSKCWLCSDRDETVNHISECSKLAQKEYKARHDWVGKVIHWDMCKKFKFDHSNKWYMHISQWINLPTQSCLALYSFCANLLYSLM